MKRFEDSRGEATARPSGPAGLGQGGLLPVLPCNFGRFSRLVLGILVGLAFVGAAHGSSNEDGRGVLRATARVLPAPLSPPIGEVAVEGEAESTEDEGGPSGLAETGAVVEIQTQGVLYRIRRGGRAGPEELLPFVVECVGN